MLYRTDGNGVRVQPTNTVVIPCLRTMLRYIHRQRRRALVQRHQLLICGGVVMRSRRFKEIIAMNGSVPVLVATLLACALSAPFALPAGESAQPSSMDTERQMMMRNEMVEGCMDMKRPMMAQMLQHDAMRGTGPSN